MRRDEIRALHEQRAQLLAEARSLNDVAEQEERDLTGEEQKKFDELMKGFEETEARARRAEELWLRDQQVQKSLTTPLEARVDSDDAAPVSLKEWRESRMDARFVDSPEYRAAIYKYMGTRSTADIDVEEHRVLSRATNPAGGFVVPTDFERRLIEARRFLGSIETLANVIVTDAGETLLVPAVTAFGTAVWTGENAAYTPSDDTFAQVSLGAHKATAKTIVSEELLQDSAFDLEAFLVRQFGLRFRVLQENSYVNGSGTGQPQGILANIPSITAAVGQTTSLTYDSLVTLVYELPTPYREGAAFVVSDLAARNLRLVKDNNGRPLWETNTQVGQPDSFLGYPITTHPNMPAPAAGAKSVMFGNWEMVYTIRRVRGFGIQRQNELHSDNGQVGFRGFERLDGRVVLSDAGRAIAHSAT